VNRRLSEGSHAATSLSGDFGFPIYEGVAFQCFEAMAGLPEPRFPKKRDP